jgi:hypothetical protein
MAINPINLFRNFAKSSNIKQNIQPEVLLLQDFLFNNSHQKLTRQIPRLKHAQLIRSDVVIDVENVPPPTRLASLLLQRNPILPKRSRTETNEPRRIKSDHRQISRC